MVSGRGSSPSRDCHSPTHWPTCWWPADAAPIARLWVAKLIIDGLVETLAEPGRSSLLDLVPLVILEFALVTLGAVAQSGAQAIQVAMAARLRARLGHAVMRVATRL